MKGIDLISASARMAGFLASGESLQDSEPSDCLAILQQMIDTWQADDLKIFGENINTFPLVVGTQTYLLGAGLSAPNFALARPAEIQRMGCLMTGSNPTQPPERPIEILDYSGWSRIPVKNIGGSYPLYCYVEYNFPNLTLNFWQIPGLTCSVVIYSWQPIATFPDLNSTDVNFPPAYLLAIKSNLAILLAAEFKTQPDPIVIDTARTSLAALKDLNASSPILSFDGGLSSRGGYYDWRADSFVRKA